MSFLAYLVSILGIACSLILFVAEREPAWLVSGIAMAVVLAAFARIARRLDRIERKLGVAQGKGRKIRKASIRKAAVRKATVKTAESPSDDLAGTIEELEARRNAQRQVRIGPPLGAWRQKPRDKASA